MCSEAAGPQPLEWKLPAAALFCWPRPALAAPPPPPAPGTRWLPSGGLVAWPTAAQPAVFDIAVVAARAWLERQDDATAQALIVPARVRLSGGAGAEVAVELARPFEDLAALPRLLPAPGLFLTAYAAYGLESAWQLVAADSWRSPTGTVIPLLRVVEPGPSSARWRNPRVLVAATPLQERPALASALSERLAAGTARLTGVAGCGKTRLAATALRSSFPLQAWTTPSFVGEPASLAARLTSAALGLDPPAAMARAERLRELRQQPERSDLALGLLAEWLGARSGTAPPLLLACDELERAAAADLAFVDSLRGLLDARRHDGSCRLLLVGRSGPWARGDEGAQLEVGPLGEAEIATCAGALCRNLEMPPAVEKRLLDAVAGNPFALEEGLLELARRRQLRRVHGSFFFGGGGDAGYLASERLVRHLYAECERLGGATTIAVAAAAADVALPPVGLTLVAAGTGAAAADLDAETYRRWGWLRCPAPEIDALVLGFPPLRLALEQCLDQGDLEALRLAASHWLADQAGGGDAAWKRYLLAAGSVEGPETLLSTFRPTPTGVSRERALAALRTELDALRARHGRADEEMRLLWTLLPLAHRMGQLRQLRAELERALTLASEPERALALHALGAELELAEGRPREAEAHLRRSLQLALQHHSRRRHLLALQLVRLLAREERFDEARELAERMLPAVDLPGTSALAAACRFYLGNVALHEQRYDDALALHTAALAERRRQGLDGLIGASLCALGTVKLHRGDYPGALPLYQEAESCLATRGREGEVSFALAGQGAALSRLGQHTAAAQPLRRALALRADRDDAMGEAIARLAVAENYLALGETQKALEESRRAHFQLSLQEESTALADADQVLGRVLLRQRQYAEAHEHLDTAFRSHVRRGRVPDAAVDCGLLLQLAREQKAVIQVAELAERLALALDRRPYPERRELLDFQLFEALRWLRKNSVPTSSDPIVYLRRAYVELLRKTSFLPADQRHGFLFGLAEHRAILEAATSHGLSFPVGSLRMGDLAGGEAPDRGAKE